MAPIDEAGPGDITFVSNRKYISHIKSTQASAIILGLDMPRTTLPTLWTENPYLVFARAIELFYTPPAPEQGIHPGAIVAHDAKIGTGASIGAAVVIQPGCVVGNNTTLYPHVVLYPGVVIGDDVTLHSHVVVREYCRIGHRVIVQNGAVIGSDGFGFVPMADGTYYKIRQSGTVIIEDDVEIGAHTAIDRAAVGQTVIRRGAKLDNLIQVGHGSEIGENSVLAAQVGLAGSTCLEREVKLAGQVGIAGHLTVGAGATITAQSGTSHDVEAGAVMSGSPAIETGLWRRATVAFTKLPELLKRVRELERIAADRVRVPAQKSEKNN